MSEHEERIDRTSRQLKLKREHEERWEGMSKQLDREYKLAWVKLIIYILGVAASIGLVYLVWNSDLPTWMKVLLIG